MKGLDVFFQPGSVAVIGATDKPGHVGRAILWNLISSPFGGTVYPVNPKRTVGTWEFVAYPSVLAIPERVELAVIVTPAETVTEIVRDCADGRRQRRCDYLRRLSGETGRRRP